VEKMNSKGQIEKELEKEIRMMPDWRRIIRGTLMKYYWTCGNKGCHCYRSKKERHGPYWYIVVNFGIGKQKMYLIGKEQIKETREGIKAYKELWESLCRISSMNIELLRLKKR
jgi:hypothetical protein